MNDEQQSERRNFGALVLMLGYALMFVGAGAYVVALIAIAVVEIAQ